MANICEYHILVKGKKNACYALYGSINAYEEKWIKEESGTQDDYEIVFSGSCKWDIDAYTHSDNSGMVEIPEDPSDAAEFGERVASDINLQDKSRIFHVEIWCNSCDIDEPELFSYHYKDGEFIETPYKDMPEEIEMDEYADSIHEDDPVWQYFDDNQDKMLKLYAEIYKEDYQELKKEDLTEENLKEMKSDLYSELIYLANEEQKTTVDILIGKLKEYGISD